MEYIKRASDMPFFLPNNDYQRYGLDNDYQRPLEIGVIKTYITDHFATYNDLIISQSKSIRSQHFIKDRPFLRDGNATNLYLN